MLSAAKVAQRYLRQIRGSGLLSRFGSKFAILFDWGDHAILHLEAHLVSRIPNLPRVIGGTDMIGRKATLCIGERLHICQTQLRHYLTILLKTTGNQDPLADLAFKLACEDIVSSGDKGSATT